MELAFHWQIMMPNLQALMPGEPFNPDNIKCNPDRETAFAIAPERGVLTPYADHEFILSFSPHQVGGRAAREGVVELAPSGRVLR